MEADRNSTALQKSPGGAKVITGLITDMDTGPSFGMS